ncbi:MAG: hypothetical protein IKW89_07150 [Bacteroidales bacterium]|nr:hypothetical protein [Bacteroidales bacterium]
MRPKRSGIFVKEFYLPASTPTIVTVPVMNFLAVRSKGNPNEDSEIDYLISLRRKMFNGP